MKRADVVEAVLFLPAMALLAAALFCVFWLIIKAGGIVLMGWYLLLSFLPKPLALALAVMLSALTVYAIAHLLGRYRRRARLKA